MRPLGVISNEQSCLTLKILFRHTQIYSKGSAIREVPVMLYAATPALTGSTVKGNPKQPCSTNAG